MMEPFTFPGFDVGLRPLTSGDLDAIMEWINDPEVTRNFAGMAGEITREQEAAFLEATFASDTDRLFAVVDRDGGYLGNAGIHKIYWPAKNGRLGLVMGAARGRGRGLGQQALKLLCARAFLELGLHKVWLVHYATNARMAHIATKLCFVPEGHLRDEYFHAGAYHDMVRYGLLEQDFEALAPVWGTIRT
ncbi:MAG: GNAT family N-acetyltransferase [Alphaproteobacteria bacterium]|nr:GNAT family N-acetyltransferase [Alphaproteobacteria bacterium]